ncbi:MAG: hypothetical protein ACTSRJ_05280 [Candidatus Hodarchaeales archaeon]
MIKKFDIRKYSNILVFSISLIPLILFLFIIWNRVALPFVFEWGESAGLNQIYRILSGGALYDLPTLEFSPLVYTPLYYYLAAGASKVIGNTLFSARLISVISSISGMVYLACFSLADGFYDLARVDSLYILIMLIAFSVIREAKIKTGFFVFGVLVVIGFFIKQSFIIVFLPLQIYLLYRDWKLSWITIAVEIVGISVPLFLINRGSEGWFFYYMFELPTEHGYSFISAINFWIGDTIRPLGIMFAFSLIFLLLSRLDSDQIFNKSKTATDNKAKITAEDSLNAWWVYGLFFAGAAGAAWITRSSNGGGANNCMPIYAVVAISFGLGAGFVLKTKLVEEMPWFYSFIVLVISIQFIGLIYNPFNFLPTKDEIRLNVETNSRIKDADLPVLIPYRSHLSWELEQIPQIHVVNIFELTGYFKGEVQPTGVRLVNQIRTNICRQAYGLIVLDQSVPWFDEQLEFSYIQEPLLNEDLIQRSDLLNWQKGNERTYKLKSENSLDLCLESISTEMD